MVDQVAEIRKLLKLPVAKRPQRIATLVHKIQRDKAGKKYIDHPRRVVENLEWLPSFHQLSDADKEIAIAAAWLHDVVEDSGDAAWPPVTYSDLLAWGIDIDAIEVVRLVTRVPETKGDAYYLYIKENPIARLVKLADVMDNCNEQRAYWVENAGGRRNAAKYEHALQLLAPTPEEKKAFDRRVAMPAELEVITAVRYVTLKDSILYYWVDDFTAYTYHPGAPFWEWTSYWLTWHDRPGDSELLDEAEARALYPDAFPIYIEKRKGTK